MPSSENRIQQLIDAGVADSPSDFSQNAKQLINALSDDEFNCLLTTREKVLQMKDTTVQEEYDKFVALVI
jgi:hypothetical protein